ncbi:MAG: OmpA family protein [Paludibacteraceae bacterium]|nr:OmpA family protein [Paludibacteraceae bacterium]
MIKRLIPILLGVLLLAPQVYAAPSPSPEPAKTAAQKAKAKKARAKRKEDNKKYARNKLDLYQIHHFTMWGGAGYSGMVNHTDTSKFIGGGGGLIGIGYEWHYKKFQLSLGPEFRLFTSQDNIGMPKFEVPCSDNNSYGYTSSMIKYYDFHNKFHETQTIGQVTLPIMFGAQFDKVPIYFMAGAKFGYTLMGTWSQRSPLTTSLQENIAMDEWFDVPPHDLQTLTYKTKGKPSIFKGALDVILTAEVGVKLNDFMSEKWNKDNEARKYPWHMRIAVFLDYGLPLFAQAGQEGVPFAGVTEDEATTVSFHQSELTDSKLNSLLVGAKFTALLQLNRPKKMKPQNPYLVVQILDYFTHKPLNNQGVTMTTTNMTTNKVSKKAPNTKGLSVQRLVPDDYQIKIAKTGYLPVDPINVTLIEGENNNLKQRLDTTYIYFIPEPVFSCVVLDEKTGEKIPAKLEFFSKDPDKVEQTRTQDPASEGVSLKLQVGKAYMVNITADNYISQMFSVGYQDIQSLSATYKLTPVEHGKTYIIQNLFFVYAKTELLPASNPSLDELFNFLNDNPGVRIRITGHTDSIGKDEDNQKLSEGRANAVRDAMIERGIDKDRIEAEGKGESQPIDTNDTDEGRQHNRRVEFTIL